MQRVCKCVFDEGPLGLSIYTTGEPPVRVRESWVGDKKDSNEEDLPGVQLFKKEAIQINDAVETVNGENVLEKDYKYVLNLLRDTSRPLTVTFTRDVYGPPLDITCKEIDFTKKSPRKTLFPEKNEKKEEQEEVEEEEKEERVGEGSNQKEKEKEEKQEVEEE